MFLEVDEDFIEHPKSVRLCRALQNPLGWAYVVKLWRFCTKYQKDGDLSGYSPEEIETALGWTLDDGVLYSALVKCGFVDPDNRIHDWDLHQGKWIKRLEADRASARVRRAGGKRREDVEETPVPTLHELAEMDKQPELPTVGRHNPNVGRTSDDEIRTSSTAKPSLAKPSKAVTDVDSGDSGPHPLEDFELAWAAFPKRRGTKHDALVAWKQIMPKDGAAVLAGIEAWRRCHDWKKDNGEYIPGMAPWLRSRSWETTPPALIPATSRQPDQMAAMRARLMAADPTAGKVAE